MTGLKYPTNQEKMMAQQQMQVQQQQAMQQQAQYQMMAQQAQAAGQQPQTPQQHPPDPKVLKMLQTPSWEDIQEVMQDDMMRTFRVDIETDSTIQAQAQQDQKSITELLKGITDFMHSAAGPVQSGVLTIDAAKAMLMAAVRRFKLGREVEDALEDIEEPKGNKGIPQEEVQKQIEQIKKQAEQQVKQSQQQAKDAEQKAMTMAKEAEQRAAQQAKDAISKAQEEAQRVQQESQNLTVIGKQQVAEAIAASKEFEHKCNEEVAATNKRMTEAIATEKARNKLAEQALQIKFDRQIFNIEKKAFVDLNKIKEVCANDESE